MMESDKTTFTRSVLQRCEMLLENMTKERTGTARLMFGRWSINHEPLRNDAANILPLIRAILKDVR